MENISKSSEASKEALRKRQQQYQGRNKDRAVKYSSQWAHSQAQILFKEVYQTSAQLLPVKNSSTQYKGPKKYIADTGAPIDAVGRQNLPAKD